MNIRSIRDECCEANKALLKYNLVDSTFGNVSCFDATHGVFVIKPSGVPYAALTPADMVIVDLDGKKVKGRYNASSDTETHRCLFRAFPTIRAIAHTHSRNAVAFAQANRPIPCFGTTHADYFWGEVPVTRPMRPAEVNGNYEWETGNVIVERFLNMSPDNIPGVLVSGHGPFTWGNSATKAVENAVALELIADMAMKTLSVNPNAVPISQALLDKHYKRKHGPLAYYGQPNI